MGPVFPGCLEKTIVWWRRTRCFGDDTEVWGMGLSDPQRSQLRIRRRVVDFLNHLGSHSVPVHHSLTSISGKCPINS